MVDQCKFVCEYLVDGECQQGGGDCLEDDCPRWEECENCLEYEECSE